MMMLLALGLTFLAGQVSFGNNLDILPYADGLRKNADERQSCPNTVCTSKPPCVQNIDCLPQEKCCIDLVNSKACCYKPGDPTHSTTSVTSSTKTPLTPPATSRTTSKTTSPTTSKTTSPTTSKTTSPTTSKTTSPTTSQITSPSTSQTTSPTKPPVTFPATFPTTSPAITPSTTLVTSPETTAKPHVPVCDGLQPLCNETNAEECECFGSFTCYQDETCCLYTPPATESSTPAAQFRCFSIFPASTTTPQPTKPPVPASGLCPPTIQNLTCSHGQDPSKPCLDDDTSCCRDYEICCKPSRQHQFKCCVAFQ